MRSLSGAVALGMGPTADGADVTVVTGSNFSVSTPATPRGGSSSSASSQAGTSSTGTSSSGTHASSQLAAPTSSNEPLAPFDPRSCTASGGEGA